MRMCRRCDAEMVPGQAIEQTWVPGMPDFIGTGTDGDMRGQTMTAGGPGKLVDVLKCPLCGHSVSAGDGHG
jgi:hypothetical protein